MSPFWQGFFVTFGFGLLLIYASYEVAISIIRDIHKEQIRRAKRERRIQ